eukprot:scaffold23289_cov74-Cyclotella_meneghiniana.AAC.4
MIIDETGGIVSNYLAVPSDPDSDLIRRVGCCCGCFLFCQLSVALFISQVLQTVFNVLSIYVTAHGPRRLEAARRSLKIFWTRRLNLPRRAEAH